MQQLASDDFFRLRRNDEIKRILSKYSGLFAGKDLLEIGSGTGIHLEELKSVCRSVRGIDVEVPDGARRFGVIPYDGLNIPFPDSSFDVIFSSNVLEHIQDQQTIHKEMHRVLRPGGRCIHVVPVAIWRVHASLLYYPDKALRLFTGRSSLAQVGGAATGSRSRNFLMTVLRALPQRRHGELGNWFTEHFLFRTASWKKRFEGHGWRIESCSQSGVFGTGYDILGRHLDWNARARLAKILGSHTTVFVLR